MILSRVQMIAEYFRLSDEQQQYRYLTNLLIGCISFWFIVTISRFINRLHRLPNGPWGLPFVGYIPSFKREIYLQFIDLSKKYGPVFSVKLARYDFVILNDWPSIKEGLAKDELLARPRETFLPSYKKHISLVEMSGIQWRDHRRVTMRLLRDVGMGKSAMEEMVKDEITQFIVELDKHADHQKPCDFFKALDPSVSNNVATFLFGHRFDYQDPEKIALDNNLSHIIKALSIAGIGVFSSFLPDIIFKLHSISCEEVRKSFIQSDAYLAKEIDIHLKREEINNNQPVVDYIDGYLREKRIRKARGLTDASDPASFDIITLQRNLAFYSAAGSGTTRDTICWAMMFLVKYPEYQEKIREEILTEFGPESRLSYADRYRLPFTTAFIYETHRYGSLASISLFRRASKDVKIGSHTIPKDTFVTFNFYALHFDPQLWKNPEEFNPLRFLSEDGSKATRPPYLLPFSGGKRMCPGEALGSLEVFLYLTTMIQRFQIKSASNDEINTESVSGINRRPKFMPLFVFEKVI